ncbi:MAG: DUF401 family protein [Deltaproteobacteria bacterium]|nr:DUF401 family protein [Deltaproteobacteria bacterium]
MIVSIPSLVKVLCVFCLILSLNRMRIGLSYCLLIGSLVLGLWMKMGLGDIIVSGFRSLLNIQTISLILIVGSILVISRLMKESRHLDRIVKGFSIIARDDRAAGAVLPALIGLLPMPGGALFSAPMVETTFDRRLMTNEQKTAVNYWFRHIWEYWWPLYPGVVLAVALLEVETWQYMTVMAPMTLVTVAAGIIFILRPLDRRSFAQSERFFWPELRRFLWEIMPILIVVAVIAVLSVAIALLNLTGVRIKISGALSILPGLMASAVWVCAVNHISLSKLRSALFDRNIFPLLLLIAAIMVFKGIMVDSNSVVQIRNELIAYHIPVTLVIMMMPFLSGFITGIAIGFVGTSFPLIIPLFDNTTIFSFLSYAALAYSFGYMGMMLSPVHLCFLVTKDYFRASFLGSYRLIILPSFMVMAAAVVLFYISRAI